MANKMREEPVVINRPGSNTATGTATAAPSHAESLDGKVVASRDGRKTAHGFAGMLEMFGAEPDAVKFDGGDTE